MSILRGLFAFRGHGKLDDVHRAARVRLAELGVENAPDIRALCAQVGARRGRPIHLIAAELEAAHLSGFWLAVDEADFILYEANTSKPHQEHIIAHELAHIICCHRGDSALDDASAKALFPNLAPELVRDMLRRTGYSDAQEQEAEVLASLILQSITFKGAPPPAESGSVVERIRKSLT